jgi:predicted phosphodiesterase
MKKSISMRYIPFSLPLMAALIIISYFAFAKNYEVINSAYLQALTPNSVIVMVESRSTDDISVKFSKIDGKEKTAKTAFYKETETSPKTYVHRILLDGLEPDTEYNYEVFVGGKSFSKAKFRSGVLPGTPFRFAAMGDCRSNPKVHSKIAELIHSEKPLFSLYGGDICANESYESFRDEFFIPAELKLSAEVPFFNAVGNHEDWSQNTRAFTQWIESNSTQESFYSFDIGDVHFLVISTEHGITKDSEQWKFFVEDLKENKSKWTFALSHIPAYCSGGHGENHRMKRFVRGVLKPGGVDVFLTGHSHFYQRNYVEGMYHIVTAGGGAPLYTPKKANYVQKKAKVFHYCYFDVTTDQINMTVKDIDGKIIDTLELKK